MTMVLYNTSKQQMQHQLQVVAYAGNEMELSQATTTTKKSIPYPCIHFNHLADELVSETSMRILAAARNSILH
jgi:hypothetical protein